MKIANMTYTLQFFLRFGLHNYLYTVLKHA